MDLDESLSKRDEINAKVLVAVDAGHPSVGPEGQPHRAQGHPAAARPGRLDGAADEGRAREARQHPRGRGLPPGRDPARPKARSSRRSSRPKASAKPPSARPRRASAWPRPRPRRRRWCRDAIAKGNVQAINYFVAQKYIEAFKALAEAPNQKFVMMPMESAGVIGSLAGIAELAKEALDRQPARARRRRAVAAHREAEPMQWDWRSVTWAAVALLLFAAEALAPGAFMLWLGFAAAAVFVDRAARARTCRCWRRWRRSSCSASSPSRSTARWFRGREPQQRPARAQPPRRGADRPRRAAGAAPSSTAAAACRSPTRTGTSPARIFRPAPPCASSPAVA